ncbi:unnamed protein product [Bursaphelenchus okinawaensis]|uniref:JmjC domain-containing protein n=1 Tax=Bursaphelenchus okinawaensis TaxID=465554 RepID=A0A811KCS2_9BILA|nr:unnamed protein product [Bursaphelenchus okinawaensis]CAG9101141.1 unnamed protein product [Bursaphelenchus okinawaensis]
MGESGTKTAMAVYLSVFSAILKFIEPQVLEHMPSPFKSFKFLDIDMGDMPFRVSGLKVYTHNVGRDRIIVDLDVAYAGDAELKVKTCGFNGGMNELVGVLRIKIVETRFAGVVHGSKLWFLTEPDKKPVFDPDRSTLDWYLNDYPKLEPNQKPFECLMKPGELIYFPDKWYHATLNMETSVFISTFLSGTAPSRPRNEL